MLVSAVVRHTAHLYRPSGCLNPGGALRRWLKFNAVGAVGIGVQLAALAVLKGSCDCLISRLPRWPWGPPSSTNFVWHELWTWKDRRGAGGHASPGCCDSTSATAWFRLWSTWSRCALLVGRLHMQYLIANIAAITAGSLATSSFRICWCSGAQGLWSGQAWRAPRLPSAEEWWAGVSACQSAYRSSSNLKPNPRNYRYTHPPRAEIRRAGFGPWRRETAAPVETARRRLRRWPAWAGRLPRRRSQQLHPRMSSHVAA